MKKIEFIWRHLLVQALEHQHIRFQQQALAHQFHLSSSTVNLALQPLRQLGAVRVGGRGFEIADFEKILYHWANHRRLEPDIRLRLHVNLPILEIEGRLPNLSMPTAYTAVRERFGEPPADYSIIYVYHPHPQDVAARFAPETFPGPANLFVLAPDPFLASPVSLPQIFVDLWNLSDWYAKDFTQFVKTKIDELLP